MSPSHGKDPSNRNVRELRFADCDQLSEMISGGDASFVQLGAGSCKGSMRRIDFDGFYILLTDVQNHTVCHVASGKDTRVVHVVDRWSQFLRWNGQDLSRPGVIVWGDSCDYRRVGCDVRTIGLVFDEAKLRELIETWAPAHQGLWDRFDGEMLPDTPEARRFMRQVSEVMWLAERYPERLRSVAVRRKLGEKILLGLVEAVEIQGDRITIGGPTARERSRIVGLMTEHLLSRPDQLLGMTELCRLTGSSARSIGYACQTILDTSPMRYLKRLRLNRARILLREGSPGTMSVAEGAYSVGFSHLGRFSVEYRAMFGESPHETLSRIA